MRENLREKIVNTAKEEIWIHSSTAQIHEAVETILSSLEDESLFVVQRLLRNLKYVVPEQIEMVDPYLVKQALTTSKVESAKMDNTQSIMNNSISKPMVFKSQLATKAPKDTQMESSKASDPGKQFQSDVVVVGNQAKLDAEANHDSLILVEKHHAETVRVESKDTLKAKEPPQKNPKTENIKNSQDNAKKQKK